MKSHEFIREKYEKTFYLLVKAKNFLGQFNITIAVIVCVYFVGKATTSLINWIFFVLTTLIFAMLVKRDGRAATLTLSRRLASALKIYSAFILVSEIAFIIFIGEAQKSDRPDSLDQRLKRAFPGFYDNLDFIGLRMYIEPGQVVSDDFRRAFLWHKYLAYICYLLISLYIEKLFEKEIVDLEKDHDTTEEEYRKLFEFAMPKHHEEDSSSSDEGH